MARKDVLAAGQRAATFVGAAVPDAEDNIFRNIMSEEDAAAIDAQPVPEVEKVIEPRMKFIPNPGVLLVRPIVITSRFSNIIIEEDKNSKEKPSEGTVLACGDEVGDYPSQRVGAHVVYGKYSGTEFKLNGEVLLLMQFEDVKGTLVPESEQPEVETTYECPQCGTNDPDNHTGGYAMHAL